MKAIKTAKTRPLPTRGGLNDLVKTGRTIADYSKATPVTMPTPTIIQNIRNPRRAR